MHHVKKRMSSVVFFYLNVLSRIFHFCEIFFKIIIHPSSSKNDFDASALKLSIEKHATYIMHTTHGAPDGCWNAAFPRITVVLFPILFYALVTFETTIIELRWISFYLNMFLLFFPNPVYLTHPHEGVIKPGI